MAAGLLALSLGLGGCTSANPVSGSTSGVRSYSPADDVLFEGMRYRLYRFAWVSSIDRTQANARFLVVDLSVTNMGNRAREEYFRPLFSLVDDGQAQYEEYQHIGGTDTLYAKLLFQPLNPNVEIRGPVVFDVPPDRSYRLRVLSPTLARRGFGGSIDVAGRYFYFDLPPGYRFERTRPDSGCPPGSYWASDRSECAPIGRR